MNTLILLVALSQSVPPPPPPAAFDTQDVVVEETAPQPQGRMGWTIAGPTLGGIGGAIGFGRLAAELLRGTGAGPSMLGTEAAIAAGGLIGAFGGWYLGKLAREGSTAAKIASVCLYVLSGSAIALEAVEVGYAAANWHPSFSLGFGPIW